MTIFTQQWTIQLPRGIPLSQRPIPPGNEHNPSCRPINMQNDSYSHVLARESGKMRSEASVNSRSVIIIQIKCKAGIVLHSISHGKKIICFFLHSIRIKLSNSFDFGQSLHNFFCHRVRITEILQNFVFRVYGYNFISIVYQFTEAIQITISSS